MPSAATLLVALAATATGAAAIRQRRKERKPNSTSASRPVGVPGEAAALITFGAPAGSDPAMAYPKGDGCFPGLRMINVRRGWLGVQHVDYAPPITRAVGFDHPKMRSAKLFVEGERDEIEWADCGQSFQDFVELPEGELHEVYALEARKFDIGAVAKTASIIALPHEANYNPQQVADAIRPYGWSLAASVYDGRANSHLMQERSTKNCYLTFQGSKSTADWLGNLQILKKQFCGLSEKVHWGFRENLRRLADNPEWQQKIRGSLPSCANVYLTGHSLGGTTAQFVAACAASAPAVGAAGREDYDTVGWTTGEVKNLQYPWD